MHATVDAAVHYNRKLAMVLQAPPPQHQGCCGYATAEEDEEHRRKGEALLPELKSMEFLPTQASDCRAPVTAQPHARGATVRHLRLSVHCQSPGLAGGGFRCRYSEPYTGPIRRRPNELNATRFQRGFYIEQC